jgi:hypothetical protein
MLPSKRRKNVGAKISDETESMMYKAGHGSRAVCTVFPRSEAGIVGSNPTQGMGV